MRYILFLCLFLFPSAAFAQGQDSTPGERNILVMAEMLPGIYDNVNQNYFDGRRKLPEDDVHPRLHTEITRIDAGGMRPLIWEIEENIIDRREPFVELYIRPHFTHGSCHEG